MVTNQLNHGSTAVACISKNYIINVIQLIHNKTQNSRN